jgi:orotate phosphoribosyltransferase-like protein
MSSYGVIDDLQQTVRQLEDRVSSLEESANQLHLCEELLRVLIQEHHRQAKHEKEPIACTDTICSTARWLLP